MKVLSVIAVLNFFFIYGESFHKPEEYMKTCELVQQHGYPCEIHEVTTSDGYILELHRIPHGIHEGNKTNHTRPAVFLQHGLVQSSSTWIINSPNQSLGYMLAERGYDVWMGNSRGNTYSYKHTMLTHDDEMYWDFSWVEMAELDLPAAIGHILAKTGHQQIDYIGHSQGTTMAFAAFSKFPSLGRKIKLFIALAPITHVAHIQGLMGFFGKGALFPVVKILIRALGVKNFLPNSWVIKTVAEVICKAAGPFKAVCSNVLFLLTGYDTHNLNMSRLNVYFSHTPAGTSSKDIVHFGQMVNSGLFRQWDYGWNGNMHKYKQPFPPEYYVGEMRVPVALFTGSYDWLSTIADVSVNLRHTLPSLRYFKNTEEWNHMDFVWGLTAKKEVYDDVFLLLQGKKPGTSQS